MATPMSRPILRLLTLLLAAALLATACGDDSGDSADADEPTTTTSTTTTAPSDDGGDETTTTTTKPIVLTDSFRGVTAETIKIGVVAPDLESLRGLVDLDHGSYEAAYRAVIADVNANGGILGRQIEVVVETYLPIGTESADEICSRFVDDEQVFAVIGGLLGDTPLCYTELNDTIFVGSGQNDSRMARATAPWFTGLRNADESARVIINGFHERGFFDGAAVAVVADLGDVALVEDVALPLLDDLGVNVVDVDFIEAVLIDDTATDAEVGLMAERQELENADTILTIGGAGPRYAGGIEELGYRPRIVTTSLGSLRGYIRDRGGRDFSVLADSAAGNTAEQLGWWADNAIQECIALVEAATGETILDPNTRGPQEPENIVSVASACRNVRLFAAIAEAAGGDLTNDTFGAAGESLGEFHIPGLGMGNYGPDSPDGDAPIYLYEWNEDIEDLESDGTVLG
jgi:branched-chain amino acid transport system substrate-binding protein